MKNILILIVLAGLAYGVYHWLESYSGGAVTRATKEIAGGQLTRGQKAIERTRKKIGEVNVGTIVDAIRKFREQNGRNPESLQELYEEEFLYAIPHGVSYDPSTGEVTVSP